MTMKKLILVLCTAIMVFSLVGCAGGNDGAPAPGENDMEQTVSFTGVISEISGSTAIVTPNEGEPIRSSGDKVSISIEECAFEVGDTVVIVHFLEVMESYPLQIKMVSIEKVE